MYVTLYVKIKNVIHIWKNVDTKMKVKDFIDRIGLTNIALIYKNILLKEYNTLESYGIKNEDTLIVLTYPGSVKCIKYDKKDKVITKKLKKFW